MGFLRKILKIFVKLLGYDTTRKKYIKFKGWGLISNTYPPWMGKTKNKTSIGYKDAENKLIAKLKNKKFHLSQFSYKIKNFEDNFNIIKDLRFRHYYVYYSSLLAFNNTSSKNVVECGVCDGLTIFFCMSLFSKNKNSKFYLYDSWSAMRAKELIKKDEKKNIGSYDNLDIKNTKNNLIEFKNKTIYNKGFIPDIFSKANNPKTISWLHIDLNSSMPTLESLKFFYPKLEKNGVILFDDYGGVGYEKTRDVVENFFKNKKNDFLHLPTGQAIVIKK
jgi:hypothetical protein